jgi:hypothetical protein
VRILEVRRLKSERALIDAGPWLELPEACPVELDACPVELDAYPVGLDAYPVELDACPVKLDISTKLSLIFGCSLRCGKISRVTVSGI